MALANVEARTTRIDCPNCAKTAEEEIQKISGVAGARVDLLNAKVYYAFDSEKTSAEELRRQIEKLGHFKFIDESRSTSGTSPISPWLGWTLLASAVLYGCGAVLSYGLGQVFFGRGFFYLATAVGGWDILRRAIIGIKHRRLDINALMIIAIIGAIILGDLHEAVVVVLLFGLANMLESYSLWRLSKTLGSLSDFTSEQALLKQGSGTIPVPPDSLVPGDTIVLREGMRIAADGRVVVGTSFIDLASLTGESQPRSVGVGDDVFAGAINLDGYLEVAVISTAGDSRMGKILKLIGEASARKAKIERFVDRFAKVYTPIVVLVAVLVAVIPPLLFDASFTEWIYKALVLLVISCPCALVISTPIAVTTALAAASRMKAVFKGGDALERLATINTVAFDKTGTLTTGRLRLVKTENCAVGNEAKLLQIAGSLEQISQHPIARSLTAACAERNLSMLVVENPKAIAGVGVEGTIGGIGYQLRSSDPKGNTGFAQSVALMSDRQSLAIFKFADEIREEARSVVNDLREIGIDRVGILSGDEQSNVEQVRAELDLDFAHGNLMPDQKYEKLTALGDGIVMVGDGINDVVALSGSDVSISLARFGNDIQAQHSDIIFFGDTLTPLPKIIQLGKKTLGTIKMNIAAAFAIKAVFLVLAALGFANIWMAVAADMGASLLVIFNSLRLLK